MENFTELKEFWNYYAQKYSGFNITDKGTSHDYINSYYNNEFINRDIEINLVEIHSSFIRKGFNLFRNS